MRAVPCQMAPRLSRCSDGGARGRALLLFVAIATLVPVVLQRAVPSAFSLPTSGATSSTWRQDGSHKPLLLQPGPALKDFTAKAKPSTVASAWLPAGAALLLLACSGRSGSPTKGWGRPGITKTGRHSVALLRDPVDFQPAPASAWLQETTHCVPPEVLKLTPAIQTTVYAKEPAPITATWLSSPVALPCHPVPSVAGWPAAAPQEDPGTCTPSSNGHHPGRALFVGGTRHARRQRVLGGATHEASTSRSARRAVGARLQPAPVQTHLPDVTYDASKVRTKLQVGLQTSSRSRCRQAREFEMPSANAGLSGKSGVLLAASLNIVRHRNGHSAPRD